MKTSNYKKEFIHQYLIEANIVIPDEDLERFLDIASEKINTDSILRGIIFNLVCKYKYNYDSCHKCGITVITRGDNDLNYTVNGDTYCPHCFNELYSFCEKCGRAVEKNENSVIVHNHYYCVDCASDLLNKLVKSN